MINACCNLYFCFIITVHGDIRRLEIYLKSTLVNGQVHGDIRRLEKFNDRFVLTWTVHGDIRRLENH